MRCQTVKFGKNASDYPRDENQRQIYSPKLFYVFFILLRMYRRKYIFVEYFYFSSFCIFLRI